MEELIKYYIIYTDEDAHTLEIVEIEDSLSYEINHYIRASRRNFTDKKECIEYAKKLAKENKKIFTQELTGEDLYLD